MKSMCSGLKFILFPLILLSLVAGCASYNANQTSTVSKTSAMKNLVTATSGTLEIQAVPMFDEETAKGYLGISPGTAGMVPVYLKVQNNGDGPIRVETSKAYLSSGAEETVPCLSLEAACDRARRNDGEVMMWGVAFGMFAMMASASNVAEVNRTIDSDYQQKQFKPALINAGGMGEGVLFFDVPKEKQAEIRSAVLLYSDLGSGETREVRFNLR